MVYKWVSTHFQHEKKRTKKNIRAKKNFFYNSIKALSIDLSFSISSPLATPGSI